jgi:hypothetical protein
VLAVFIYHQVFAVALPAYTNLWSRQHEAGHQGIILDQLVNQGKP